MGALRLIRVLGFGFTVLQTLKKQKTKNCSHSRTQLAKIQAAHSPAEDVQHWKTVVQFHFPKGS